MSGKVKLSRRSFLGGVLAVAGAAALPNVAMASVPVIYGDGIHDDTAGLQALLDGKAFKVSGKSPMVVRQEGAIYLSHGSFKVSDTIFVGRNKSVPATHIFNCQFDGHDLPQDGRPILHFKGGFNHVVEGCYFESAPWRAREHRQAVDGTALMFGGLSFVS